MIWLLTFGLCIAAFAYIAMPFYLKNPMAEDTSDLQNMEVTAYRGALKNIESQLTSGESHADRDLTALAQQKTVLEKRLVRNAKQVPYLSSDLKKGWMGASLIALITGTFGIYSFIGTPKLSSAAALKTPTLSAPQALSQNAPNVQHENNESMQSLVAGLEAKLKAGDKTPQSWGLYARSLMTLNRFDDAIAAYETTLSLTDNNPDIKAELDSARAFIEQQKLSIPAQTTPAQNGPSRADIQAAQSLSPQDRSAMIQGMVDGLSEKLAENPDDPNGWVRLLRARKVLNQETAAQKDLQRLKTHFANNQKQIETILKQSGWNP